MLGPLLYAIDRDLKIGSLITNLHTLRPIGLLYAPLKWENFNPIKVKSQIKMSANNKGQTVLKRPFKKNNTFSRLLQILFENETSYLRQLSIILTRLFKESYSFTRIWSNCRHFRGKLSKPNWICTQMEKLERSYIFFFILKWIWNLPLGFTIFLILRLIYWCTIFILSTQNLWRPYCN